MKWFYDLGIRKKFYAVFGSMILLLLAGVVIIDTAFLRVQVGGRMYRGIEMKRDVIDLLSEMRSNVNLLRGLVYVQLREPGDRTAHEISGVVERTGGIFGELRSLRAGGNFSCLICHDQAEVSGFFSLVDGASGKWKNVRAVLGEVEASTGQEESADAVLGEGLAQAVNKLEVDIENALSVMREVSPAQVKSISSEADMLRWALMAGGLGTALFLVFTASTFSSLIIEPVRAVAGHSTKMAGGEFKDVIDIKAKGNDEIGEMVRSFNEMSERLREISREIVQSTERIVESSEWMSKSAVQLDSESREQALQTDQAATAMNEMSQTIMEVAHNAADASKASEDANEIASYGKDTSGYTIESIHKSAKVVSEASEVIEALGARSKEIGDIVTVINEIADQTNLLALNAAIEAARAGEQGRGFAVVADEVRKLAERTSRATGEITSKISQIQDESTRSVDSMRKSREEIEKGVKLINAVSQSYESIVSASATASDMVQRIAAASEEQSTAAEEVSQSMHNIAEISRRSSKDALHIKNSAEGFLSLAAEFRKLIGWFKL